MAEAARYEHALVAFPVREHRGTPELVIQPRDSQLRVHTHHAPIHTRDLEHPQFPWTCQRYLYDCLHDYVVEMFLRTPQGRDVGS